MTQERQIGHAAGDGDSEIGDLSVDGNRLSLLPGGPERLTALLHLIEHARERLDLCFYIFDRKGSAVAVREALIDACNRGVAVTLLVDAFGTATTPDSFFAPLIEAGARFGRFGRKRSMRYLIRNHQKMAIADGRRVMIGGFNIADDYFVTEDDPRGWRDMGVIVDGPAVPALQCWFDGLADWTLSEQQSFRALRRMVRKWDPGRGRAVWLMGGPTRHLNGWARCVRRDLQADHKLDMAAAYFSPGWGMVRRLGRAARAGCVRIVVPSRSDNTATVGAARHLYRRLLQSGVSMLEYQPQMLHAKLLVIDDVAYVGSANFDMRSLFLNVEIMLRIEDRAVAQAVRDDIDAMAQQSRIIDEPAYKAMARPLRRLRWWFDYLLVGVLDYTVTRRLNFRRDMRGD